MKFKNFLFTLCIFLFIASCASETSSVSTGGSSTPSEPEDTTSYYTIYFNSNNGDGYMEPLTVLKNNSVVLSPNGYNRVGFVFKGWSTSKTGSVEYMDNSTVSFNYDVTLYAVWEEIVYYKVRLHSNNGDDSTIVEEYPSHIMPVKLPYNTFTYGDKKFTGWYTIDNKEKYIDGDDSLVLTGDIDLYASWEDVKNVVTITFNPVGASGSMPALYALSNDIITLPYPTYVKNGYQLQGTYSYGGKSYRFGDKFKVPDTDADLYTVWIKLPEPPLPNFGGNSKKYIDRDVFVDGITIKEDDWVESLSKGLYYAVRKSHSGWYDTDQSWLNLCWAGSASNLLHWWHDKNKDNVQNYYDHYAPLGYEKPDITYEGWGKSHIFGYFSVKFPNKGYYTDRALQWYIAGKDDYQPDGGGFYKEVFGGDTSFVEFVGALTQYKFQLAMEKAFDNNMGIGGAEINMSGSHAITIWGAHYNSEGLIDRIYVADSATVPGNNTPGKQETGVSAVDIVYDSATGQVRMKTYLGGTIPLTAVILLSNGADKWEEFFKNNKPLR